MVLNNDRIKFKHSCYKQIMLANILFQNLDSNQDETIDIDPQIFQKISLSFDETIVINELKQKIGIQDVPPNSETYKDLIRYLKIILSYPSTEKAQFHREANRLGNFDVQKGNQDIRKSKHQNNQLVNQIKNCECCGLIKQEQQLKICSQSFKDVASVGISTYMFYITMINLSFLLLLAQIIFGSFALGSNIKTAFTWNSKGTDQFSSSLIISLGSKIYLAIYDQTADKNLLIAQVWLGLAMVILFIFAYLLMQRIQVTQVRKVQTLNKSASDFTVVFMGVPLDVSKQEIESEILKLMENKEEYQDHQKSNQTRLTLDKKNIVAKINVGIPKDSEITQKAKHQREMIVKVIEEERKFKEKIVCWIMQLTESTEFQTPVQVRNKVEEQFLEFRKNNKKSNEHLLFLMSRLGSKVSSKSVKKLLQKQGLADEDIENQLKSKQLIKDNETGQVIKTDAFVTLESRQFKQKLLTLMQNTVLDKFLKYLTLDLYQKKVPITLNGQKYKVRIQQASEPEDVIWDNIGTKPQELFVRKCITFFITFLILGISFATVYGLSSVQIHNQDNRYISFLISLCLSIFNFIILITLRTLTTYELSNTQTDYQSSLAVKAIFAQLVNTIVIPILVNRFLKNHNYMYEKSGLAQDVFLLGITNSFLGPIMKIFNVYYLYLKYFNVWYCERPKIKFFLSQKELNRVYELQQFQNGIEYVYIITLYLFTCFFMSLQPVIILFSICGYLMNYWAQKYCLFHRCKRPVPGTRILYDTMVQFIYSGGLFYSMGSLCFINLIPEDVFQNKINAALIANLIAVGVSVFSLFIPFSFLYEILFGNSNSQNEEDQLFSKDRVFLLSQYDRTNPATRDDAITEYITFVNEKKNEIKNRSKKEKGQFLEILQRQARNNCNYRFDHFNPLGLINPSQQIPTHMLGFSPNMISNYFFTDISNTIKEEKNQRTEQEKGFYNQQIQICEIMLKFAGNPVNEGFQLKKQQFSQAQLPIQFLFNPPQQQRNQADTIN